jgi:RNA polymerase sigma-70 factor, ECF subfamily
MDAMTRNDERRVDEGLALRLRARDPLALEELYGRCGEQVYRLHLYMVRDAATAEDLTQETFLYLWTRIAGFDATRGSLVNWVYLVAKSRALDYLRSTECRIARHSAPLDEAAVGAVPRTRCAEAGDIETAMQALKSHEREILRLAHWDGMSQSEIAVRLNRPLGTVKTWMRRGQRSMRAVLENALAS